MYRWGGGLREGQQRFAEGGFAGCGGAGYEDVGEGARGGHRVRRRVSGHEGAVSVVVGRVEGQQRSKTA